MDHGCGLGGLPSSFDRPGTYLFDPGGKVADESQDLEGFSDDLGQTGFRSTQVFQELLLLRLFHIDHILFDLGTKLDHLTVPFRRICLDFLDKLVIFGQVVFIHVGTVDHVFVGNKTQVFIQLHKRFAVPLFKGADLVSFVHESKQLFRHFHLGLGVFVTASGDLGDPVDPLLQTLDICQQQFRLDRLDIPDRVDMAVNVGDVLIFKSPDDMQNSVRLFDVGEKLVSKPLPFAGPFNKSGDIHKLDHRVLDTFRVDDLGQFVQTVVRYGNKGLVRLDRTEGIVCRFGILCFG